VAGTAELSPFAPRLEALLLLVYLGGDEKFASNSMNAIHGFHLIQAEPGAKTKPDLSLIYPVDPKRLPKELAGKEWPPKA
jgi:hypothetical protein